MTLTSYSGYRSDLRKIGKLPTKQEIEEAALILANKEHIYQAKGVMALDLSKEVNISKEWARRILKDMERKGILRKVIIGQGHIYKIEGE